MGKGEGPCGERPSAAGSAAPSQGHEPPGVGIIRQKLANPPDLVVRPVTSGDGRGRAGQTYWVVFLETIADRRLISDGILEALAARSDLAAADRFGAAMPLFVPDTMITRDLDRALRKLLDGWVVIFPPEGDGIWLADASGRPARAVEESKQETGVRIPREGFTEVLTTNLSLIRARIRHPGLRFEERRLGSRTGTRVMLAYVDGLMDPELLQVVRQRLDRINLESVLETGYIEEFIEDSPYSPFPQTLRTERPDVVAGNLLEGRFAILVDGTPFVLIGPVVLTQLLTTAEDYYERFLIGSLLRLLRYLAFLISLVLPGVYVAVTTYHYEMVPTALLLAIASAREGVPFPTLVEALIMEFELEILREAGVRLPAVVGPAVSIVGALVLGQAAISANLASPAMVIVVASTAIASFATPVFSVAIAARIIRFAFLVAGAALGLFGIQAVAAVVLVHLCALRSFGVPYLTPLAPLHLSDWKDLVARSPWWAMVRRPAFLHPRDPQRLKPREGAA